MPKANRRTNQKRTDAAALIAKAQAKGVTSIPLPDAATLAELRKLVEYNDTATHKSRVTIKDAIEFLRARGWNGGCKQALDRLCVSALGRRSYGTP